MRLTGPPLPCARIEFTVKLRGKNWAFLGNAEIMISYRRFLFQYDQ